MITHLEKFPWILKHQQTSVSFLHSMQEENLDTVGMETWETKTNSLFGEGGGHLFHSFAGLTLQY